jgi:hypothetical protein
LRRPRRHQHEPPDGRGQSIAGDSDLAGKLDGFLRVPTPNVSVVDLVAFVEKKPLKKK